MRNGRRRRGTRGRPRHGTDPASTGGASEMVAARRSICVARARGKTTTAAMIAYAAQALRGIDRTCSDRRRGCPSWPGTRGPAAATCWSARPTSQTAAVPCCTLTSQ